MQKEYYHPYETGKTNNLIQRALGQLKERDIDLEDFFLLLAADISYKNVRKNQKGKADFSNIEGGPFAAVIVRYEGGLTQDGKGIGKPEIIGIGANHVVPENDPSAHGEISAIRDATHRLKQGDLSDSVMYTSCECCPQCQAAVTGVGIRRVVFANSRFDAKSIGFSDEEQYHHVSNMEKRMTFIDAIESEAEKRTLLNALGNHGAAVLDQNGGVVALGDEDIDSYDPTDSLPSMKAIRTACKKMNSFHLPEGSILISRNKLHPVSFITADWARIGRVRDENYPNDPEYDAFEKDASRIIYIEDSFEEMKVQSIKGQIILATAEDILQDVTSSPIKRTLTITHASANRKILDSARKAFDWWRRLVTKHTELKY